MPVATIVAMVAGRGMTVGEIIAEYPGLTPEDVREALKYALAEVAAPGPDLNALTKNSNANTPLQAAVAVRKVNLARTPIAAGADAKIRTAYGWTALHIAAHNGDLEMARLLIESSVDARARNDKGLTAKAIAIEGGHKELASYLEGKEQEN